MNPSKFDKWPRYERVHLVLVQRERRYERPWQGLVVEWRKTGRQWEAFVVFIDDRSDGTGVRTEWLPASSLTPLDVDPNPRRDAWF